MPKAKEAKLRNMRPRNFMEVLMKNRGKNENRQKMQKPETQLALT